MNIQDALSLLELTENGRVYTSKEIKSAYRKLINFYHPDKSTGDVVMSQLINGAMKVLKSLDEVEYQETESSINLNKRAQDALNKIKSFTGITIEVIGMWVWVSGNTYPIKDHLNEAGYHYSKSKKSWYFNGSPQKLRIRSKNSMDDLRSKHGHTVIKNEGKKNNKRIAA